MTTKTTTKSTALQAAHLLDRVQKLRAAKIQAIADAAAKAEASHDAKIEAALEVPADVLEAFKVLEELAREHDGTDGDD